MIGNDKVKEVVQHIGEKIIQEKEYLTELDQPIGDSDHGINMARGFAEVEKKLPGMAPGDIGATLKAIGMTLVSTVGGASGPLYGTFFMRAGMALAGKKEMDFHDFLAAFEAGMEGVMQRGKSKAGEKTMLDSMAPALDQMKKAYAQEPDWKKALQAGLKAAEAGMEHTKDMIATKGRASYLGERSLGHQDPGATSFTYMLQAITQSL